MIRERGTRGGVALAGLAILGLALAVPCELQSAELRLRAQYAAEGPLVRLGDVAEIVGADHGEAESLAATELFPAPAAHEQRSLGIRELQDLLVLHGVNLAVHQFSGSSQILVLARTVAAEPQASAAAPAATARRARQRLCAAVVRYLEQRASAGQAWVVEADVGESQVRLLADPARAISVAGGQPPWTGAQHFQITIDGPQGAVRLAMETQVSIRAPLVLTVHSLARGDVIREGDVELQQQAASCEPPAGALKSLEEAIGHETVRAVAAGKVLSADALRTPLWVRRGDVVSVYARTAGIQVRTAARARDDGSQGDLVSVESLLDRSAFYARVSGLREVEVYARAPRVETAEAAPADVLRR